MHGTGHQRDLCAALSAYHSACLAVAMQLQPCFIPDSPAAGTSSRGACVEVLYAPHLVMHLD
jgi:hypothetical protein